MTNLERIEAVAWVAAALGISYGRATVLLTRQEVRAACRLYAAAKRKRQKRPWPVPAGFLEELEYRRDAVKHLNLIDGEEIWDKR